MFVKTEEEIMRNWNKKMPVPLVSIRCITYNHHQFISQALDSFLMQETSFPFEIIVHDDASTDGTIKIIKEYEKNYPNIIKPIYEEENIFSQGYHKLNEIINQHLNGKYIMICEGDDYWCDSNKIQKQISFMEKHSDYSLCFNAANYLQNNKIVKNDLHSDEECDFSAEDIIEGGGMFCATASLCCRKDKFVLMPEYRKKAWVGDYPLQILLATKGKVHYFPEIMTVYRFFSENSWTATNQTNDKMLAHWKNEIEWLDMLDLETDLKYHNSVLYKKFVDTMAMYLLGENNMITVGNSYIKEMNDERIKHKSKIKLVKTKIKKTLPILNYFSVLLKGTI